MAKIHKIDPNADTVIILKNPLVNFAVWNCPDVKAPDATNSASSVNIDAEERSAEESAVEPSESDDSSHEMIQYHVSSSVLRLASSHFERMLSGKAWKEGTPNEDDGRYHIVVEDWDEEAFLLFLNALHHRSRQVPRKLILEMFAKIAVVTEYYNCVEAIELWAETWIKNLPSFTELAPSRDLFLWMYIAWVFRLPDTFRSTTAVAIGQCNQNELSISNLPVARFLDRISQARLDGILSLVSKLHNLQSTYLSMDYRCLMVDHWSECGSMLYGTLTKGMNSLGLLSTSQKGAFSGISLQETCTNVRKITSPKWGVIREEVLGKFGSYSQLGLSDHSKCDIAKDLQKIVNEVQNKIKGFELTDFAHT